MSLEKIEAGDAVAVAESAPALHGAGTEAPAKLEPPADLVACLLTLKGYPDRAVERLALAAAERVRELEGADGWRPIAEAPRDGSFVDLWLPGNGSSVQSRRVPACRWSVARSGGAPAWFAQQGGMAWNMGDSATHWMPLPVPPATNTCPAPGDIRVINGKRCRFIERELEGDKWEVLDS